MVQLLVKRNDEEQFILDTTLDTRVVDVARDVAVLYNARLKIRRMVYHLEDLAKYGITLPPNMQGLTDEQISELKLHDEWSDKCIPSGGYVQNTDEQLGRRNGRAPNQKMQDMMKETMEKAKEMISKKLVKCNESLTLATVQEAYNLLKGAATIVYPMGLPPHDPLHLDLVRFDVSPFDDNLDRKDLIDANDAALWFSGKQLIPAQDKTLRDYIGKNEKCKVVVKLTRKTAGPPAREDILTEEQKRDMMQHAFKRQEEIKTLHADDDDSYMNSAWANPTALKQSLHGLTNIKTQWESNR